MKTQIKNCSTGPIEAIDIETVSQQLGEMRAQWPQLPGNDGAAERNQKLNEEQQEYQYSYDQVPGVAMLQTLPSKEYPHFDWLAMVGQTLLDVVWNQELVEADEAFKQWRHLFRKTVSQNLYFIFDQTRVLIDRTCRELFGKGAPLQEHMYCEDSRHLKLKQLVQSWTPTDLKTHDSMMATFSGLIPQLIFDVPNGRAYALADYASLFKAIPLPPVAHQFQSDAMFGYYRVAGPNPTSIKIASDHWQNKIPLTQEMFAQIPGYENGSLEDAFDQHRLFLLEYPYLDLIETSDYPAGQKYLTQSKGLFYRDQFGSLMPIAICCEQGGPVFTPQDGYSWEMAKSMLQVADSNYHELVAHLGHTHLVLEAFVIASHRQLAKSHPVFKLLAPHFEGTAFINWAAKEFLVAPGNFVDQLLAGSIETSHAVVAKSVADFQFNQKMPDRDFDDRGVYMSDLLYPYRDDALLLWGVIQTWVGAYIDVFYKSDKDVVEDTELRAFAREVVSQKGGRIADFGENKSGDIRSKRYLVRAISMIIFTASAQHAAVNFTQSELMAYLPSMPLASYGPAPSHKRHTRQDWLEQFAPLQMANQQLAILHTLGSVQYTTLGQYDHHYFKDDRIAPLVEDFQIQLAAVRQHIARRNAQLAQQGLLPYSYLSPQNIPQSINI